MTNEENLFQKTKIGIGWTTLAQVGRQGVQFIISIILTRLLTPEDFGLMGMIVVFTGFIGLFSELGFGAALIQRDQVEEQHYSSIFWINLIIGVVITGIVIVMAPLIAFFYREPRLIPITRLIAINFMIMPLMMVQIAKLNRAMDFRLLALVEITAVIIAGGIAITLALTGHGVWSLAWQTIVTYLVTVVALWWLTQWRPKLIIKRKPIGELMGFSSNLLGFNVLNYWVRNADNLLVGKFLGTIELGIYSRAYSIMVLPLNQVSGVLGRVMFPALSRVQNDKARVKSIYLRSISLIALVTFPMMLGLFVTAENFVLALLGSQWQEVIPVLRILSLLGMVQSIGTTVGWIYQSQGRTDWMFRWSIGAGILLIVSIMLGIWLGTIMAVASCYAIMSGLVLLYPSFAIPGKLIEMSFREVLFSVAGVFTCAAVMSAAVWLLSFIIPATWPSWAYLIVQILTGATIYVLLLNLLKIKAYFDFRTLIREQLKTMTLIVNT
jgi:O-antigen/teichoic acid export membrane protein